jgi:uncharacterized protein
MGKLDVFSPAVEIEDIGTNPSNNLSFDAILNTRLSRRSVLRGALTSGGAAILSSLGLSACAGSDEVVTPPFALNFNAVAKGLADAIVVPPGYTASVIFGCGESMSPNVPAFKNDGTDTNFDQRAGDCHDGIHYFGLSAAGTRDANSSARGLLAMNHEYMTPLFLHPTGPTPGAKRVAAEVDKEVAVHGCAIVEVAKSATGFSTVQASTFNRRITAATPIELSGPVRGTSYVKTKYSPAGTATRGTQNNCGTGTTPWGTFLTAEENWAGYFGRAATDNSKRTAKEVTSFARYGIAQNTSGRYGWVTAGTEDIYARWDNSVTGTSTDGTDDYRNVSNTFGYIVEIDPYTPGAMAKKRTALGRTAHEACVFTTPKAGRPLAAYSGDDSRNEYIYKFVSTALWNDADANPPAGAAMSVGDKYMDSGALYVAKFNADGTGQWLLLNKASIPASYTAYSFADDVDVLVNARLAADAVGATKLDRPEWGAVNAKNNEIYFTLTNNSNRTAANVDAANPRAYSDAQAATSESAARTNTGNVNGHILRFRETGDDQAALTFQWDVYLFGAESIGDAATINLSGLTAENDFSSPDGLWFSKATGAAWIQTDDGSFTDVTNCMLLAAIPGQVGDGAKIGIDYTVNGAPKRVESFRGALATPTTVKRFLVAPAQSEVTGITETPDGKTLFVNIQHPGEATAAAAINDPTRFGSHWPGGGSSRPRSATVVITKDAGGLIGS